MVLGATSRARLGRNMSEEYIRRPSNALAVKRGGVAKGGDPQGARQAERAAPTFGDLAKDYLELYAKRRKRSWGECHRSP
jgi:hypothetical protein